MVQTAPAEPQSEREPWRPAASRISPSSAGPSGEAARILALQRSVGNRAVARMVRGRAPRDGKSANPTAVPTEELEGHDEVAALLAGAAAQRRVSRARTLQRLKITQHKIEKKDCGQRNVQWVFALSKDAPEDGYIVQHITASEDVATCPNAVKGTLTQNLEFWEAWLVKKGDKVDWTTTRDKWTDGSTRPARAGERGTQVSAGELKFFKKTTTGDLGDFNIPSSDAGSAWGPGKVGTSGALPSTPTKPSWWDDPPVEGPVTREARSQWDCCDADAAKHTSNVTAKPEPARWWQFWRWFE